jgi:hypothetical protein
VKRYVPRRVRRELRERARTLMQNRAHWVRHTPSVAGELCGMYSRTCSGLLAQDISNEAYKAVNAEVQRRGLTAKNIVSYNDKVARCVDDVILVFIAASQRWWV